MLTESEGRRVGPSPVPDTLSRLHYLSQFLDERDQNQLVLQLLLQLLRPGQAEGRRNIWVWIWVIQRVLWRDLLLKERKLPYYMTKKRGLFNIQCTEIKKWIWFNLYPCWHCWWRWSWSLVVTGWTAQTVEGGDKDQNSSKGTFQPISGLQKAKFHCK